MTAQREPIDEHIEVQPKRMGKLRRWLPWLLYGALIALIGGVLLNWLVKLQPAQVVAAAAWFRKGSQLGALLQIGLCCWVVAGWRSIVAWGHLRGFVARKELREVQALRWRAAAALSLYLALVPIGVANIARFFLGFIS